MNVLFSTVKLSLLTDKPKLSMPIIVFPFTIEFEPKPLIPS